MQNDFLLAEPEDDPSIPEQTDITLFIRTKRQINKWGERPVTQTLGRLPKAGFYKTNL